MQNFIAIFAVIFAALSDVLDTIVFKRVSEIATKYSMSKLSISLIDYVMVLSLFFLPLALLPIGNTSWRDFFSILYSPWFFCMLLGMVVTRITTVTFFAAAYANEKISVLTPYAQVSSVLGIILGFVLFPGVTDWRTFACALVASIVLWLSNLEGGRFHFNKYCLLLLVSQIAQTIQFLLAAKLVERFSPLSVTLGGVVVGFVLLGLYFIPNRKELKLPQERMDMMAYWRNDGASNAFWMMNTIISLFLYQAV